MSNPVDSVLASTGAVGTYGGSAAMIGGWWLSNEFAILVGMVLGVTGLAVQWYYKRKLTRTEIDLLHEKNNREQEAHEARMAEFEEAKMSRSQK